MARAVKRHHIARYDPSTLSRREFIPPGDSEGDELPLNMCEPPLAVNVFRPRLLLMHSKHRIKFDYLNRISVVLPPPPKLPQTRRNRLTITQCSSVMLHPSVKETLYKYVCSKIIEATPCPNVIVFTCASIFTQH